MHLDDHHFDIAILGLGAMGLSALDVAARRGLDVVGIDQFVPPHDQGSTHGETRLIREAYSEDARYIPLLQRSLELWREHDSSFEGDIFHETGVQYFGPAGHPQIRATRASAGSYKISLLELPKHKDCNVAAFQVPEDWDFFHEVRAGYLAVESFLGPVLARAQRHGARCITGAPMINVDHDSGRWQIGLGTSTITCNRAIFTLGPWVHELVPQLAPLLTLERHTQHWLEAPAGGAFARNAGFRPFVAHLPDDQMFYGFPENQAGLVKIAEHCSGKRFAYWREMDRTISEEDHRDILSFRDRFAPALGDIRKSVSCMYTMTPDGHFILDRHPNHDSGVLLAGLSGHGYKFAPVMGEILVKMALGEDPGFDLSLFALSRFR